MGRHPISWIKMSSDSVNAFVMEGRVVSVSRDGEAIHSKRLGLFAKVSTGQLSAKSEIVMSYDLPIRSTEEQMPSGRCYRFKWRGDEIIGFSPQDAPMPFYPILKEN